MLRVRLISRKSSVALLSAVLLSLLLVFISCGGATGLQISQSRPHRTTTATKSSTTSNVATLSDSRSKCAFFRVVEPSTTSWNDFVTDLDEGGLGGTLAQIFGWPLVALQQGFFRALFTDVGLDTLEIDGYTDGVLSHKDLMWPHRDEIADYLTDKSNPDGMIHINDIYAAKLMTAEKYGMNTSYGSFNEVPLIFVRCGGDLNKKSNTYGMVNLEDVLLFFNGDMPSSFGQIDFRTLPAALSFKPSAPSKPTPLDANGSKVQVLQWQLLTLLAALMQLPTLLSKVATQVLCPAHWFKKEES